MQRVLVSPFRSTSQAGISIGLLTFATMLLFEVPWHTALLVLLLAALHTTFGGLLLEIFTRRAVSPAEFIGFGFAIGSLIALCVDQGFVSTALRNWSWTFLAVGVLVLFKLRRREMRPAEVRDTSSASNVTLAAVFALTITVMVQERYWPLILLLGVMPLVCWIQIRQTKVIPSRQRDRLLIGAITAVALLAVVVAIRQRPSLWWIKTQDFQFFESLAFSLANFGSRDQIYAVGLPVEYHWFSYGWVGMITRITNAEEWIVLTRAAPVLVAVAVLIIVISILMQAGITGNAVVIGATTFVLINDFSFESFSMIHSYLWLISGVWLAAGFIKSPQLIHFTISPLLIAGAYGAKSSNIAVLASVVGVIVLFTFYRRSVSRFVVSSFALAHACAVGVVHWFLYANSSYSSTIEIGTIGIARNLFGDIETLGRAKLTLASLIVLLNLLVLHVLAVSFRMRQWSSNLGLLQVSAIGALIGGAVPLAFAWSDDYELEEYFLHAMSVITSILVALLVASLITSNEKPRRYTQRKVLIPIATFAAFLWFRLPVTNEGDDLAIFLRIIMSSAALIVTLLFLIVAAIRRLLGRKSLTLSFAPLVIIVCCINVVSLNQRWFLDFGNFKREITSPKHEEFMLGRADVIAGAALIRANTELNDIIASNYFCEQPFCAVAEYGASRVDWKRGGEAMTLAIYSQRRFWVTGYGFLWQNTAPPIEVRRRIADSLTTIPDTSATSFYLRDKFMPCQCEEAWQKVGETSRFELFRL